MDLFTLIYAGSLNLNFKMELSNHSKYQEMMKMKSLL